jgi:hypothetical protein
MLRDALQLRGPHLHPCRLCGGGEQILVQGIAAIFEERPLPTVATLRDMARDAGNDESGSARPEGIVRVFRSRLLFCKIHMADYISRRVLQKYQTSSIAIGYYF